MNYLINFWEWKFDCEILPRPPTDQFPSFPSWLPPCWAWGWPPWPPCRCCQCRGPQRRPRAALSPPHTWGGRAGRWTGRRHSSWGGRLHSSWTGRLHSSWMASAIHPCDSPPNYLVHGDGFRGEESSSDLLYVLISAESCDWTWTWHKAGRRWRCRWSCSCPARSRTQTWTWQTYTLTDEKGIWDKTGGI